MDPTDGSHGDSAVRALAELRGVETDVVAQQLRASLRRAALGLETPPTRVGRFEIVREAGRGAMGVVYEAHDPSLDRRVAIKILRRQGAADEAALLREGRTLARLSHPNIVSVYEVGVADGHASVFVAMEFIAGGTLRRALGERTPARSGDVHDIVASFLAIGEALAAAHRDGVVHGDFKPDNVLVDRDGRPKVVDFGLARVRVDDTRSDATSRDDIDPHGELLTGPFGGTPAYAAPEVLRGRGADALADQYSFCVALAEALWGTRPQPRFDGWFDPPPGSVVPPWIHAIVARGLAGDPTARHPSMAALLVALRRDPHARRRRLLGLGALATAFTIAGAAAAMWRSTPSCPDPEALFATTWNPARREALQAGLLASAQSFAPQVAERLIHEVDQHRDAWGAGLLDACRAGRIERIHSEEILELRYACLERRRRELDVTLSVLESRGAAAVIDALDTIGQLESPEICGDVDALLAAPRTGPEDREAAEEIRDDIRRVLAMAAIGADPGEALELARATAASAARLDDRALHSAANHALAVALDGHGDLSAARAAAEAALWSAYAVDDAQGITLAASHLVYALGYRAGDAARAQVYAALGRATTAKGGVDTELQARLAEAIAASAATNGDVTTAVTENEAAITLLEQIGDTEGQARVLEGVGQLLDAMGRTAQAREALERAVELRRARLGDTHPSVARAEFLLAWVMVNAGEPALGLAQAERAYATWRAAYGDAGLEGILMLRTLGQIAHEASAYDRARTLMRDALAQLDRSPRDWALQIALTHGMLGELALDTDAFDEGATELEAALAGFEPTIGLDHEYAVQSRFHLALLTVRRAEVALESGVADARAVAEIEAQLHAAELALASLPDDPSRDRTGALTRVQQLRAALDARRTPGVLPTAKGSLEDD
jgi:tRNA A-37 threonylcarbamoyl transferase component Bud32/tetratricopeptide (TPR) repeat protein